MRTFVAIAIAAVLACVVTARRPKHYELEGYGFEQYLSDFGKSYKGKELELRKMLFDRALFNVKKHNANGAALYKKGINHMSDWTEDEKAGVRGLKIGMKKYSKSKPEKVHQRRLGANLPRFVDYRTAWPPVLTAVKDQGHCGSCWAHSATEAIETAWAQATGELYVLSQQQINSCTPNPDECGGTGGCGGAIYELGFDYIVAAGGIAQEWTYPYTSYFGDSGKCEFNASKTKPVVTISGYTQVGHNDHDALLDALATSGPVSISVQADTWPDYESGVFDGCSYNISMDHAVQAVGYGHDYSLGVDYWIVRNSWSPGWGEAGYIRLKRSATADNCGWNVNPQNGDGCKGQTEPVWACGMCGIAYDPVYVNAAVQPPKP